jgi:peptidyl-prolyl cis-trans isomerase SurA
MLIKKIIRTFLMVLFLTSTILGQQVLDKIVAIVDDDIILQSDLLQYTLNLAFQMQIDPRTDTEKFAKLQQQVLENIINQKILLVKAEEDTIQVSDREVDNVLDTQINRMIEQLGSVEKLEEYMGAPLRKIKRDFREEVKNNLKVETLKNQKIGKIQISRREVERFYDAMKDTLPEMKETVDISHILLKVKPGANAEKDARKRIEEVAQKLKDGADFAELVKQYSEDPGSKTRNGELGFFQRGEFVREFEEVAFNLQPGEISDIVLSEHGFHIIQMIERRGEKINVRHILIRLTTTEADEKATQEQALEIRKMLDDPNNNFSDIAKKYSEDETSKEQGGHLGQFAVEELQEKEFKRVVKQLNVDEISQPFRTRFGWHIMKLNNKEEGRKLTIEHDWENIEKMALNAKQQNELEAWLTELKKSIYIDVKK